MVDQMTDERVEILSGDPGDPYLLNGLKDPVTGRYFRPQYLDNDYGDAFAERALKTASQMSYMAKPGASEAAFEAEWPQLWADRQKPSLEFGEGLAAVLDTGLMSDHPLLTDAIVGGEDFTGSGDLEDRNGHGTMCALLLQSRPYLKRHHLLNVKVMDAQGRGSEKSLIAGLEWLIEYKEKNGIGRIVANLSVGVYSKKWLAFACDGTCRVCKAAIRAAEHNITVVAAAGNQHGVTACPATAGLREGNPGIFAVAGYHYANSGIGSVTAPSKVRFEPLAQADDEGK